LKTILKENVKITEVNVISFKEVFFIHVIQNQMTC